MKHNFIRYSMIVLLIGLVALTSREVKEFNLRSVANQDENSQWSVFREEIKTDH
jgi:hypothetical protein